ncbi:MAG: RNase H family protein [bacterium]|nr:RNase H family protein [bacterium]
MNKKGEHLIFTDGSSLGNPGPGGWAAVILLQHSGGQGRIFELGGREKKTTNNRMELLALIDGLRRIAAIPWGRTEIRGPEKIQGLALKKLPLRPDLGFFSTLNDLTIYLDSSYVHKGATEWSHAWMKNGWQTKAKKDVENRDLWEILLPLLEERKKIGKIIWKHIPGHSGIAGNERADAIATGFAKGDDVELYEGDLEDYTVDILNTLVDDKVAQKRSASRAHSRAKAYSYLSLINGKTMRHTTWADCEKRVKGVAGVRYKKTLSPEDEKKILREWGARL